VFFLFSDDPEWTEGAPRARRRRDRGRPQRPDDGAEDLRLLSLCRHHVIANSSFSWWGAWLCEHAEKIVVAPDRWFADRAQDTSDLLPARWVKL
jgi:hypothetical protein